MSWYCVTTAAAASESRFALQLLSVHASPSRSAASSGVYVESHSITVELLVTQPLQDTGEVCSALSAYAGACSIIGPQLRKANSFKSDWRKTCRQKKRRRSGAAGDEYNQCNCEIQCALLITPFASAIDG